MAKQSNKLTAKGVKNLSFDVNGAALLCWWHK